MHVIVNLFGGPGSGKSTTASGLFHLLKLNKIKTELALEYAKDVVYDQCLNQFNNQFYIAAQQHNRLWRIIKYYEDHGVKDSVIITDSPLLLSILYNQNNSVSYQFFNNFILTEFLQISPFQTINLNVFLNRVKDFDPHGRIHSKEESERIDDDIYDLLEYYSIDFYEINGDENAPRKIFELLKSNFKWIT